jgi:phage replication-related protein YjqB (UPF0714/DUF867 family)
MIKKEKKAKDENGNMVGYYDACGTGGTDKTKVKKYYQMIDEDGFRYDGEITQQQHETLSDSEINVILEAQMV